MRCPYCGGLNADQARFCARCGRDIIQKPTSRPSPPPSKPPYSPPQQPSYSPPRSPQPVQPVTSGQTPEASRARSAVSAQSQATLPTEQRSRRRSAEQNAPARVAAAPAAESPTAFPPRTVRQLEELESGALVYTVLDESESYGRKKIVRIAYPGCTGWQQVATLYKALNSYRTSQFDTIIIYGVSPEKFDKYQYTNGMLQLDQKVHLGSQVLNRYQIETENGFSSDALRIVLTEER